jgi:hypothetical protein
MVRVACVATFSLSFLLLAVSVPCAGTATDAARSSGAGQFSFLTWLHSLTHSANHRRIASSPSLPRPRPSHLEPAPNASSKAPPIYD